MYMAWIGALIVGLSLGLLGSGGSILTVPILVYLVGEPDKLAITESLGIVGSISLVGFIPFAVKKQMDWRTLFLFGIPGMAGSQLGAIVSQFVSGTFQLVLFAIVMLVAAVMMFRNKREKLADDETAGKVKPHAWWKSGIEGLLVGVLTGLVGVGGGFMIVPALVLLGGLPMHLAVGTSLGIITLNSFSGFYKYLDVMDKMNMQLNWQLILVFALIGAAGSFIGRSIGNRISQDGLRKGFAVFLVFMGIYILYMKLYVGL